MHSDDSDQVHFKKLGRRPKAHLVIALDCGSISQSTAKERGGVATVTAELLRELAYIDKRNEYRLYSFAKMDKMPVSLFGARAKNIILPRIGFNSVWMPLHFFFTRPHVFIASSQSWVASSVPTLGFIYDVAFMQFPNLYANYIKLTRNTKKLISHAKHLITISESSKEDILKVFKLHYKKISVCYPGVGSLFKPVGPKYVDIIPYFLYVGTIKKTKNINILLEGFARFLDNTSLKYRLVLIGKNEMQKELHLLIKKFSLTKFVSVKGYVSTSDLPKYYRGAAAFVSPALYEGFGLPLIEAMACGIPVIGAKNSAMNEVVDKAGLLVNAAKPEDVARALEKLVTDKKLKLKLSKAGLRQVKRYNWRIFARCVLDSVYKYCV